ncbi:metal ABC transporter permease [Brevibacterium ravenspurgense]|uniref:metal ABC transporter permease n=1 Tax=Brevibacterium ravenspurgense TaxID=479117 RepID=UPI0007838F8C|nr:metal ABC transporter permease [Brevibacterium ravenspurgense]
MSIAAATVFLAVTTAVTCALPGVFLVLRRQSMLVDAMSHAVLPGVVIGAIVSGTTHSPWMIAAASAMGMIVVLGSEWLRRTGLIARGADQGLIFPALFAGGVILLSTSLKSVHICEDTVLTGDLNLMALPSEHVLVRGVNLGPQTALMLLGVFAVTAIFIACTYRVLSLATFDPVLARTMGLPVRTVDYTLMALVAVTVVVAFNAAGAILVVALVVVPPAVAVLFGNRLPVVIALSLVIAVISAVAGFWTAYVLDLPTAPLMAAVSGVLLVSAVAFVKIRSRARAKVRSSGRAAVSMSAGSKLSGR